MCGEGVVGEVVGGARDGRRRTSVSYGGALSEVLPKSVFVCIPGGGKCRTSKFLQSSRNVREILLNLSMFCNSHGLTK